MFSDSTKVQFEGSANLTLLDLPTYVVVVVIIIIMLMQWNCLYRGSFLGFRNVENIFEFCRREIQTS